MTIERKRRKPKEPMPVWEAVAAFEAVLSRQDERGHSDRQGYEVLPVRVLIEERGVKFVYEVTSIEMDADGQRVLVRARP